MDQANKIEDPEERWLKASQVQRRLNISKTTMHNLLRRGVIPGKKVGYHWRIPEKGLKEYLEQKEK